MKNNIELPIHKKLKKPREYTVKKQTILFKRWVIFYHKSKTIYSGILGDVATFKTKDFVLCAIEGSEVVFDRKGNLTLLSLPNCKGKASPALIGIHKRSHICIEGSTLTISRDGYII